MKRKLEVVDQIIPRSYLIAHCIRANVSPPCDQPMSDDSNKASYLDLGLQMVRYPIFTSVADSADSVVSTKCCRFIPTELLMLLLPVGDIGSA